MNIEYERLEGYQDRYFAQMFFPEGYFSKALCITDQITFGSDDPVLNIVAETLSRGTLGILIVFGLGKVLSFKYENKKLMELK